jgi:predicted metal-binding membrane protein
MIMVGQEARLAEPLDRRHKRLMLATVACVVLAAIAVVVYGTRQTNLYGASAHGCVNVHFASELGSASLHKCGVAAREWCSFEQTGRDPEASLILPQCRLAGFPSAPTAAPARSSGNPA